MIVKLQPKILSVLGIHLAVLLVYTLIINHFNFNLLLANAALLSFAQVGILSINAKNWILNPRGHFNFIVTTYILLTAIGLGTFSRELDPSENLDPLLYFMSVVGITGFYYIYSKVNL